MKIATVLSPAAMNMKPLTGLNFGWSNDFINEVMKQMPLSTNIIATQNHLWLICGEHANP